MHGSVKNLVSCSPHNANKMMSNLLLQNRCLSSSCRLLNDTMYTESHEWVRFHDDGKCTVGITDHAQSELGDVVFVELPDIDTELDKDEPFAVIESVKAASDINSPVEGTVVERNDAVTDDPALINKDAMGEGWLIQLQVADDAEKDHLLTEAEYKDTLA